MFRKSFESFFSNFCKNGKKLLNHFGQKSRKKELFLKKKFWNVSQKSFSKIFKKQTKAFKFLFLMFSIKVFQRFLKFFLNLLAETSDKSKNICFQSFSNISKTFQNFLTFFIKNYFNSFSGLFKLKYFYSFLIY